MLLEHRGKRPQIHPSAYIAPTATLCGDVIIAEHACVLFGAVITAEGGKVSIGSRCIIMENAVIRGTGKHPVRIDKNVLVGPHAYLSGCTIEQDSFLASGTRIFNGAIVGRGSGVRINGTVHVNTTLAAETVVPIGWIAIGNPAQLFPPEAHEQIWPIQEELDFLGTVFDMHVPLPSAPMEELARRYTKGMSKHFTDRILQADETHDTEHI